MNWRFRTTWTSLQRTLQDYTRFWRAGHDIPALAEDLPPGDADYVREMMNECLAGRRGEVAARQQAALIGETYRTLNDAGRRVFLQMLACDFALDRNEAKAAAKRLLETADDQAFDRASAQLYRALDAPYQRLLRLFNALPDGVKFLIELRADLRRYLKTSPELVALDRDLQHLLATWFDVGFLEVEQITWESPAALLEKLITYEAVHTIQSWDDLRNRLESDRNCYAFFHPAMPDEPLIFIEVALVEGLATSIQALLDQAAPDIDLAEADTAIFYSISNTQSGLQGISFGPFLIKQVVELLRRHLPNLKTFSTLSPIPGFRPWLAQLMDSGVTLADRINLQRALDNVAREINVEPTLGAVIDHAEWFKCETAENLKEPLLRLAARYLNQRRDRDNAPLDPVARFHLGNGSRIEQLNWLGDTSSKGMQESCGLMANYLYRLKEIEKNIEAYSSDQEIVMSSRVRNLLREDDEEHKRLTRWTRLLSTRKSADNNQSEQD